MIREDDSYLYLDLSHPPVFYIIIKAHLCSLNALAACGVFIHTDWDECNKQQGTSACNAEAVGCMKQSSRLVPVLSAFGMSAATIWSGSKYSLASWMLLMIIPSFLAVAL